MSTLALPDDLARAAAQQVAMERQAAAILQNLTFGIFCQLAPQALRSTSAETQERRNELEWCADAAQDAAMVMAERFGFHFSRRAPEAAT